MYESWRTWSWMRKCSTSLYAAVYLCLTTSSHQRCFTYRCTDVQSATTAKHLTNHVILNMRVCPDQFKWALFLFVCVCVCPFWCMKESSVSCAAWRDHRLALSLSSFSFLFSFSLISLSLEAWSALWPHKILPHTPPDPLPLTFHTEAAFSLLLDSPLCLARARALTRDKSMTRKWQICLTLFLISFSTQYWAIKAFNSITQPKMHLHTVCPFYLFNCPLIHSARQTRHKWILT